MQTKYVSSSSSNRPSLLRKAVTLVGMIVLGAVALMFSAVLLVVVAVGGAYLWWKTRALRRQFKEMQARMRQMHEAATRAENRQGEAFRGEVYEGEIIEGEAVRVHETEVRIDR
jgi:hypothetical protein